MLRRAGDRHRQVESGVEADLDPVALNATVKLRPG
jgi:hypothetical protein